MERPVTSDDAHRDHVAEPTIKVPPPTLAPLCVRITAAGRMLGVGRSKIYELIKAGEIETIKLRGAVLIPTKSREAFVARHARLARPP